MSGGEEEQGAFSRLVRRVFSFDIELKEPRRVPEPPTSLRSMLGPGAIISAMAIGAGELIFWPVLVTKHGFGLLWLIPIALIVQFFWIVESSKMDYCYWRGLDTGDRQDSG
ncbi:MAG: hypothetical protein ABWW69_02190 [Pyrodictiaceae archaeon]